MDSSNTDVPPVDFSADLERFAGVAPAAEWLQEAWSAACGAAAAAAPRGGNAAAREEAVFAQLLHHDLRRVLDWPRRPPSAAASALRRALEASVGFIGAGAPSDGATRVRLMVQVEDAVNVAQGLEARLGRATDGSAASTCWKLLLADGYSRGPSPTTLNGSPPSSPDFIVAMEVAPILSLSSRGEGTVVAGTKLLLDLDLSQDVRRQVVLLTPDNCLVLGGRVEELVQVQQQRRQQAQQQAGVGVDPTVRALLSHQMILDDEPPDEGEGESGDVPPPPRPQTAPSTAPDVPTTAALGLPPIMPLASLQARTNLTASVPAPNLLTVTPTASVASSRANPYASQSTVCRRNLPASANSNHSATDVLVRTPFSAPSPPTNPVNSNVQEVSPAHPPPPSKSVVASQSTQSTTSTRAHNPYSTSAATALGSRSHSPAHAQPVANRITSAKEGTVTSPCALSHHNPSPSQVPAPSPGTLTVPSSNGAAAQRATAPVRTAIPPPAPPAICQRLDFDALHEMLCRACAHKPLYGRLYPQTFVTSLRQVVPKLHFNIEKVPRAHRVPGSTQKHEYVLIARFRGGSTSSSAVSDPAITCKLSSRAMEPFFVESPDDMRLLKKTNRPRVDELIRRGGKQLQEYTSVVQTYVARLLTPPDEFFAAKEGSSDGGGTDGATLVAPESIVNGTTPILYLDLEHNWVP